MCNPIVNKLYRKVYWNLCLTWSSESRSELNGMKQIMKVMGYSDKDLKLIEKGVRQLFKKCQACGKQLDSSEYVYCPHCGAEPYRKIC